MTEISLIVTLNNQYTFTLLRSACTSMYRHMYDWNIVDYDVKQPIHLTSRFDEKLDNAKCGIPSQGRGGAKSTDIWSRGQNSPLIFSQFLKFESDGK